MGKRTANFFAMKGHRVKILLDIVVTILLLLAMAYSLIGEMSHEWMGIGVLLLLLLHLILNGKWLGTMFKGRYTAYRIFQSSLVLLLAITMLGSMVSGVILSKYLFRFLQIDNGRSLARTIHMLCGYWGFILVSLHIGLHACVMIGKVKRRASKLPVRSVHFLRIITWAITLYGVYAFWQREIGDYLLMKSSFAFFDFSEPILAFLFDYLSVMVLFAAVGHYGATALKRLRFQRKTLKGRQPKLGVSQIGE